MQYYRCKCGKSKAWGSYGPRPCEGCPDCNTTLTQHPDYHKTPEPHEWVIRYNEVTGEPYEVCINCMREKSAVLNLTSGKDGPDNA